MILEPKKIKSVTVSLVSPSICHEIRPVHPKGNQSWIFIRRIDAETETPILWPPDAKNWLIWKDRDAGKDWRWDEKEMTEDEMVGWYHRINGHEFEQAGVGDGQGGLACCSPWGCKESVMAEWLNWTELMGPDAIILFFWMLFFSQLFHSSLSLFSRGSFVLLCFLP